MASRLPSASPSGWAWHARASDGAPAITSAARSSSGVVIRGRNLAQDALHLLARADRRVGLEVELGRPLEAGLAADGGLQRDPGLAQRGKHLLVALLALERVVEHLGVPEIGVDPDVGDRDELEPRIVDPFELVAEDLLDEPVHPGGAWIVALTVLPSPHVSNHLRVTCRT